MRSHQGGVSARGFALDLRESVQLNFDPHDRFEVLTVQLRKQTMVHSETVAQADVGAIILAKMLDFEKENAADNLMLNLRQLVIAKGTQNINFFGK